MDVTEKIKVDYDFYLKLKDYKSFQFDRINQDVTEYEMLKDSIRVTLFYGKNYDDSTSYYWKHVYEKLLGFYISNETFIQAMYQLGYNMKPDDKGGRNWKFAICGQHAKKMRFFMGNGLVNERIYNTIQLNSWNDSLDNLKNMIYEKYDYKRG